TMYAAFVLTQRVGCDALIELVRFGQALSKNHIEASERVWRYFCTQPESYDHIVSGRYFETIMRGCFGPGLARIYRLFSVRDQIFVKCVLHIWRFVGLSPEPAGIGFILRKQQFRMALALERTFAQLPVRRYRQPLVILINHRFVGIS